MEVIRLQKLKDENYSDYNANYLCKNIFNNYQNRGKIIITDWVPLNKKNIENIENIYGDSSVRIGGTYNALAYLEVSIEKSVKSCIHFDHASSILEPI